MAGNDDKNAWVLRVLGVQIADGPAGATASEAPDLSLKDLLPLWMDAKETTDRGIDQLQRVLKGTEDADLLQIAEFGLNGITGGQMTKVMVALRDVGNDPTPQARGKVADAVQGFRGFLAGSPIINLLEDNPFGVAVPLREAFGPALDQIERAVAA